MMFLSPASRSIILCGDLNIDLLREELYSDFFNLLYSYNFFPLITVATRVTEQSAKCIDHLWYNKLNVSFSGAIVSDISDHYPIFSLFDIASINRTFTKIIRDHSTDNSNKLCNDVREMCEIFFTEHDNKNVDEKCSWFVEKLYSSYNHNCLRKCKTISAKRVVKPWITNNLKRMANYKHRLFRV